MPLSEIRLSATAVGFAALALSACGTSQGEPRLATPTATSSPDSAVEARIARLEARIETLSRALKAGGRLAPGSASPEDEAPSLSDTNLARYSGTGTGAGRALDIDDYGSMRRGSPQLAQAPAASQTPEPAGPENTTADTSEQEAGSARVRQRDLDSVERALLQANSLVLPPWALEIEPSLSYTHSSGDFVIIEGFSVLPAIVIGEIVSERLRRDTLQPTLTARLGLPGALQADVKVPYRYETLQTISADQTETETSRAGLGDVTFGLSGQVLRETGVWPDVLLRGEVKTTTGGDPFEEDEEIALGSGFYGVRGSVTFVKSADPAVLFTTLGYVANLPDDKPIGEINPGDTLEFSVGSALALSRELSLTFGWQSSFTLETELEGDAIPGTNATVHSLLFGMSYAPLENWALDLNFSVGASEDAPDAEVVLALPFRI